MDSFQFDLNFENFVNPKMYLWFINLLKWSVSSLAYFNNKSAFWEMHWGGWVWFCFKCRGQDVKQFMSILDDMIKVN